MLNPKTANVLQYISKWSCKTFGWFFAFEDTAFRRYHNHLRVLIDVISMGAMLIENIRRLCNFASGCFQLAGISFPIVLYSVWQGFQIINARHQVTRVTFAEEHKIFKKIRRSWNGNSYKFSDPCCSFCIFDFFIVHINWLEAKTSHILENF